MSVKFCLMTRMLFCHVTLCFPFLFCKVKRDLTMGSQQASLHPPCTDYEEGKSGTYFCDGKCGSFRTVWGTNPYTGDSSACVAARHAGVISKGGGAFTVQTDSGRDTYEGTEANGVTSLSFYKYPSSITVKKAT
jgi:hypothetical protein